MYVSTLSLSSDTPEPGALDPIADGCKPPCGCWKLNSGHLVVLLTTEPSLQPPRSSFNHGIISLPFSPPQFLRLKTVSVRISDMSTNYI